MNDAERIFLEKLSAALESEPLAAGAALAPREWDSMVLLSVIGLIDETFNVVVPMKELQAVDSVPALLELIRRSE